MFLRVQGSQNQIIFEIVAAVFKLFGEVKDILKRYESSDEEFTAEEVQVCLNVITNKFKDYFPEGMPNFGQVLSDKRMGALFNFAIDECMGYLGGGVDSGALNTIYNLADLVNKFLFGLVIWHAAMRDSGVSKA